MVWYSPKDAYRRGATIRLYRWMEPNEPINSQWGHLPVREWLEREASRIGADPNRLALPIQGRLGVSLAVNSPDLLIASDIPAEFLMQDGAEE